MKYRVKVLETRDSSEYLVDALVHSNNSPKTIVRHYMKLYPNVYMIEAKEDNPNRTFGYSVSQNVS